MNGQKIKNYILGGEFLYDKRAALTLWFGLSGIGAIQVIALHKLNNYIIFKHVFIHTLQQVNLYLPYPEYHDVNLYGPVFSLLIAPFALLPDGVGAALWALFNVSVLFFALQQLPLAQKWRWMILLLTSHEMMNHTQWMQSNALIASFIILSYVYIARGKEWLALFFIALGTLIKLYGIVGLAFFFFSKDKIKFVGWGIVWMIVLFFSPALFSSIDFTIQSHVDWMHALQNKFVKNVNPFDNNTFQDICTAGMIRRIFGVHQLSDTVVTLVAVIAFASQYLRFRYFADTRYQLYLLCSVLITTVIFSNSAESPTYIIAFPAACIWYVMQEKTKAVNAFFIFTLLLTSFSYSDIFTPYVREHLVRPYSLKALPCSILWVVILVQLHTKQFLAVSFDKILLKK